jgi:hypothetical protein
MSENKLGIDIVKQDIRIVCGIVKTVDSALADDRVKIMEGIEIAKQSLGLVQVARTRKDFAAQVKDIVAAEKQELIETFAAEFDIENDEAEAKIEAAMSVIINIGALI